MALVVAIDDYAFVADVPGAVRNGEAWAGWLMRGRGVPASRVALLRDREATREKIIHHAKRLGGLAKKGARAWLVFIGHGAPAKSRKDGVLVGADATGDAIGLYGRSVAQKELIDALGASGAEVLAVVDACFSGRAPGGQPLAPGLQPLLPVEGSPAGASILAAGAADQFAGPLPGANRPAFSYLVLGALRGWGDRDGNGTVTAAEAVGYAAEALAAVLTNRRQTPSLHGSDVSLAASAREAGPDLAALVLARSAPRNPSDLPLTAEDAKRYPKVVASLSKQRWGAAERLLRELSVSDGGPVVTLLLCEVYLRKDAAANAGLVTAELRRIQDADLSPGYEAWRQALSRRAKEARKGHF